MDEEKVERPTSMVTDADLVIEEDIRTLAQIERHMGKVKDRLEIIDTLACERKPWWHL